MFCHSVQQSAEEFMKAGEENNGQRNSLIIGALITIIGPSTWHIFKEKLLYPARNVRTA